MLSDGKSTSRVNSDILRGNLVFLFKAVVVFKAFDVGVDGYRE